MIQHHSDHKVKRPEWRHEFSCLLGGLDIDGVFTWIYDIYPPGKSRVDPESQFYKAYYYQSDVDDSKDLFLGDFSTQEEAQDACKTHYVSLLWGSVELDPHGSPRAMNLNWQLRGKEYLSAHLFGGVYIIDPPGKRYNVLTGTSYEEPEWSIYYEGRDNIKGLGESPSLIEAQEMCQSHYTAVILQEIL